MRFCAVYVNFSIKKRIFAAKKSLKCILTNKKKMNIMYTTILINALTGTGNDGFRL